MIRMCDDPILAVRDLTKEYPLTEGWLRRQVGTVRAVDGISFDIRGGETFGLVGESGCGKSTTARTLLRLEEPTNGSVRFEGEDVSAFDASELRAYRRRVQYILQDPESALNPRMTVGEAVEEPLRLHGMSDADRRRNIAADTLERIGLDANDMDAYPHEFSGGEKQRIALARALVLNPDLIVADEPSSSLDGRTKADVLRLMGELRDTYGVSILLISHDFDVVRRLCDRVAVMYLGTIVEQGPIEQVVSNPHHPYTRALIGSIPRVDPADANEAIAAQTLTDTLPDATDLPGGCRFHPRCPAIIPPENINLEEHEWQAIVRLRLELGRDWETAAGFIDSLARDGDSIKQRICRTFGLDEAIVNEYHELADAVDAVTANDLEEAIDVIDTIVDSPCRSHDPTLTDEQTPHRVACHRYDSATPGEPLVCRDDD